MGKKSKKKSKEEDVDKSATTEAPKAGENGKEADIVLQPKEPEAAEPRPPLKKKVYEKELERLHVELVKLQEWVKAKGLKVVVIFEGRDAAGKGGTIKRITETLNPRIARVVALGTRPSVRRPSGISSATSPICRPAAKSCFSTAAGTTGPASSG